MFHFSLELNTSNSQAWKLPLEIFSMKSLYVNKSLNCLIAEAEEMIAGEIDPTMTCVLKISTFDGWGGKHKKILIPGGKKIGGDKNYEKEKYVEKKCSV